MKRVLIVEDEQAIREFEAINLRRVGYEVCEAGSGEEALELFDNDFIGFDIALLDISMPGMDGFAAARAIRAANRPDAEGMLLIALTGASSQGTAETAAALGMRHAVKPLTMCLLSQWMKEEIS